MKWKMVTIYDARVDGRLFQNTEKKERADELAELLPKFYPNSKIEITARKERRYIR